MAAAPPQPDAAVPDAPACRIARWEYAALGVMLVFFAWLYGTTLYPTFGGRLSYGDSAKWQMMAYVTGTVHSPGYPIFLVLLQAWGKLLPFVEPALRITLLAPVTVLIFLFIAYRAAALVTDSAVGRLMVPAMLGTTSVLWIQATEIEVYALNMIFVGLVTGSLLAWRRTRRERYFFAGMLIYAISFAHHLTMITMLPAVAFMVLTTEPRRFLDLRTIGIVALFIAIGFTPYLYLLYLSYSDAPLYEWLGRRPTLRHFLKYLTGGQFVVSLGGQGMRRHLLNSTHRFVAEALYNLRVPGLALGLLALLTYRRRARRLDAVPDAFLVLMLMGELAFALYYQITDIEAYFLPVYFALALLIVREIGTWRGTAWRTAGWGTAAVMIAMNLGRYDTLKVRFDLRSAEMAYVIENIPAGATFYTTREGMNFLYTSHMGLVYQMRIVHPEKQITYTEHIPAQHDFYFLPYHLERVLDELTYEVEGYIPTLDLTRLLAKHAGDTVILCTRGKAGPGLPLYLRAELARQGIRLGELEERGAYAAVLERGEVVAQGIDAKGWVKLAGGRLKELGIDTIESAGTESGDVAKIRVRGREVSPNLPGLNIVVLDAEGKVVQRYVVDTATRDRVYPPILHAVPKPGTTRPPGLAP